MPFPRRQLLRMLPFAFASDLSLASSRASNASQAGSEAATSAQGGAEDMEKVSGIGGFFFRAEDPAAVSKWYLQHLGISLTPSAKGELPWQQQSGPTSFTPFSQKSKYFDLNKSWMLNFRVRNLDRLVSQLKASGITVEVDETAYPYGRFAHLHDPEGNPLELWQPA